MRHITDYQVDYLAALAQANLAVVVVTREYCGCDTVSAVPSDGSKETVNFLAAPHQVDRLKAAGAVQHRWVPQYRIIYA